MEISWGFAWYAERLGLFHQIAAFCMLRARPGRLATSLWTRGESSDVIYSLRSADYGWIFPTRRYPLISEGYCGWWPKTPVWNSAISTKIAPHQEQLDGDTMQRWSKPVAGWSWCPSLWVRLRFSFYLAYTFRAAVRTCITDGNLFSSLYSSL